MKRWIGCPLVCFSVALLLVGACRSMYYAAMEEMGTEKRHLLRSNVEKAGEEQQEAAKQFKDVLTRIRELYGFDGGELEQAYRRLKSDYERCEGRAQDVRHRIAVVEEIARDLFDEWENEIGQISNPDLKAKSRETLNDTRRRYAELEQAMRRAERRIEPVMQKVRDYVLYLKHNLNARAVGALKQEVGRIEVEVDSLIAELNASIQETNAFLEDFK